MCSWRVWEDREQELERQHGAVLLDGSASTAEVADGGGGDRSSICDCFANMDDDTMKVGLQRIKAFVSSKKTLAATPKEELIERESEKKKKKMKKKKSLRLSFSSKNRLYEESLGLIQKLVFIQILHRLPDLLRHR